MTGAPEAGASAIPDATAVVRTRLWLERAVIGLNLCPFAKSVYVKSQVHFAVYAGDDPQGLLDALVLELGALNEADPEQRDTTLLIAPACFPDFWDFNALLPRADKLLRKAGLEGVFQIASFHPRYQFMDADAEALSNYTNRAPFPTLHLLRESSIDLAVQAFAHPELIYEKNMQTLERLGHAGWAALGLDDANPSLPAVIPGPTSTQL
ncbi:MAG: DUF1415 domain-containing protein [Rhodoferax sp.]|nr:DUF1415 domain-containing protein [Rhodoferax sp.]